MLADVSIPLLLLKMGIETSGPRFVGQCFKIWPFREGASLLFVARFLCEKRLRPADIMLWPSRCGRC
jgi:hypothetical protein